MQDQTSATTCEKGKALFIPDFISHSHITTEQSEERVLNSSEGSLVWRTSSRKPKPENITLPQWIAANSRILIKLIENGEIESLEQVKQYAQYSAKIGEFAQIYRTNSVMLHDHEYIQQQASRDFTWGTDDVHMALFYLVKSSENVRNTYTQKPNLARIGPSMHTAGAEIC